MNSNCYIISIQDALLTSNFSPKNCLKRSETQQLDGDEMTAPGPYSPA